ncbi:MAG: hypothetical protein ABSH47_16870 [Bryobacteraceae bacterium]|jgi:hypothetical protein
MKTLPRDSEDIKQNSQGGVTQHCALGVGHLVRRLRRVAALLSLQFGRSSRATLPRVDQQFSRVPPPFETPMSAF